MSNWNEDGVEILKKLWAEGHSASQIAGRIGGVSRSAVISKVHRLGLSGRTTANRKPMRSRKYAGPLVATPTVRPRPAKTVQWKNPFIPGGPVEAEKKPVEPYREPPAGVPVPWVDQAKLVRTLDLEEHHCRWPIGDPRDSDTFRHCGKDKVMGQSYCEAHVRRAYASTIDATGPNFTAGGQMEIEAPVGGGEAVAVPEPNLEDA